MIIVLETNIPLYRFRDAFLIVYELVFILFAREEIEKQKAHERFMRLQEQGKTEQARKDLDKSFFNDQ